MASVFPLSAVLPAKSSLSTSPPNGSRVLFPRLLGFKWSRRSLSTSVKEGTTEAPAAGQDYVVKKVSAKEVEEMMKGSRSVPLVVDFYATWCGPCILMAQDLEMLAVEYENNALFVKVDTDEEYEFANDMQVRGLPTLYFISPDSNKDAIRTEGLVPPEMIRNIIDNEM